MARCSSHTASLQAPHRNRMAVPARPGSRRRAVRARRADSAELPALRVASGMPRMLREPADLTMRRSSPASVPAEPRRGDRDAELQRSRRRSRSSTSTSAPPTRTCAPSGSAACSPTPSCDAARVAADPARRPVRALRARLVGADRPCARRAWREIERRAGEHGAAADPLARSLARQHPARDAGRDLREADRPHRLLRARRLPPGVRRRPRPDRPRQRRDRRRRLRAPPERDREGRGERRRSSAAARGDRRGRRPRRLRAFRRWSSATRSSGATTGSRRRSPRPRLDGEYSCVAVPDLPRVIGDTWLRRVVLAARFRPLVDRPALGSPRRRSSRARSTSSTSRIPSRDRTVRAPHSKRWSRPDPNRLRVGSANVFAIWDPADASSGVIASATTIPRHVDRVAAAPELDPNARRFTGSPAPACCRLGSLPCESGRRRAPSSRHRYEL